MSRLLPLACCCAVICLWWALPAGAEPPAGTDIAALEERLSVTPPGWSFALSLPPASAGTHALREAVSGEAALDSSDLEWATYTSLAYGEVQFIRAGKFVPTPVPEGKDSWSHYDTLVFERVTANAYTRVTSTSTTAPLAGRVWRLYAVEREVDYDPEWDESYYDYDYIYVLEDAGVLRFVLFTSLGYPRSSQQAWRERVLGAV